MPVIVDYDAGNVRSVQRACQQVGMTAEISADPDRVRSADRVIFPGVGSSESAVDTLRERGLDEALVDFCKTGKPLLGICLGLQITLDTTAEGNKSCLGLIKGHCAKFGFSDKSIKVPHIGWNSINITSTHPMLKNTKSGDEFYFVHSYFAEPENESDVLATTDYGEFEFCSVLGRDNVFATQFHLEKSGELGLKLLSAFPDWKV